MRSLVYLMLTSAKNSLKELLRKPGKLIMYLILILLIGTAIVASLFGSTFSQGQLSQDWLRGIYFAFVTMFLVMSVQKGLTSGDAIFEMSDVNLLFVSPLNPRSILLYGLARLAKVSFWAGFFILFQSSTLANFGVDFGGVMVLFFVFILTIMMLTILSLVVYSATNGNPRGKTVVKVLAVAIFVPPVAYFAVLLLGGTDPAAALQATLASPFLACVPFAGWASAGAMALIAGRTLAGVLWLLLLVLAGGGMLAYIMLSRSDYYEDVLVATETAFEKKRAAESGDIQATTAGNAKVKVTKTGIGGAGASTFFYKHLRETFRQSRLGFFGLSTIITTGGALAFAIFMRGEMGVVIILMMLMWMQVFMISNGRGLRELYSHYIYLVPESPFKKVVWSNMEMVFKTLIESILYLAIPGLILGDSLLVIIGSMAAYTLFAMLLLGINYLSMRWTQADLSAGLMLTLYFLAVMILVAPGVVGALVVGFMLGGTWGATLGLLILSLWELLVACVCFALSRDALHRCDMPTMKTGKG